MDAGEEETDPGQAGRAASGSYDKGAARGNERSHEEDHRKGSMIDWDEGKRQAIVEYCDRDVQEGDQRCLTKRS